MKKTLVNELKKIDPSPYEYEQAKSIIKRYKNNLEKNKELITKTLFVSRGWNFYTEGTFYGFKKGSSQIMIKVKDTIPHWVETDIEDVYEKKTSTMKYSTNNNEMPDELCHINK